MDRAAPDFAAFGVVIGHATDEAGGTGCTVVLGARDALRGAVAVVGRATGTRELAALDPAGIADRVDAVLLAGGSAYGLDAAAGVMRWCEERGRGFPVGPGVVPIVPAAVVFDLVPCGRFDARPTPEMAYAACETAIASGIPEGSVGAGTGATVGKAAGIARAMKGGVGCAVLRGDGMRAGAIAVVNAFGDVRDAAGRIIAGARAEDGSFADALRLLAGDAPVPSDAAHRNTTIAVVVVDAPLGRAALGAVAQAAAGGLHRRVTPAGTSFDGDVVFALCPREADEGSGPPPRKQHETGASSSRQPFVSDRSTSDTRPPADDPARLVRLEALAAAALGEAVERAVRRARGRDDIPGLADAAR